MQTKIETGLSEEEATNRLKVYGDNILESSKPRSFLTMVWSTLREPMFLLLIGCSILYLALGDISEALLISAAIFAVIGITIVQEQRTERTLDALKDLSSPRSLVLRSGIRKRIPSKHIVPGDIVLITEGDRIPADGFLLDSKALKINESLLTGESVPVSKTEWNGNDLFAVSVGGEDQPFAYSGTLVVQGHGIMLIHSTGQTTAMGRIGSTLKSAKRPPSLLQVDTRRAVKLVAISSLVLSIFVSVAWWFREQDLLRSILMGITFVMSTIPEEFPVVLTIFMALGAWRISKQNVLTREMNAIETLGSASTLCVDKTGTLTENKMTLAVIWTENGGIKQLESNDILDDEKQLLKLSAFASDPASNDPMDLATIEQTKKIEHDFAIEKIHTKPFPLVRPILAVGHVWRDQDQYFVATKGAPESVVSLCKIKGSKSETIFQAVHKMAEEGYRVLAVAKADGKYWEKIQSLREFNYDFVGLLGYYDPLKPGVRNSVKQCHEAGIKVMMITGDYPTTALAIARDCGIKDDAGVLSGEEIDSYTDKELTEKLKSVRILARMIPEQKLRVVKSLQAAGEVVAMTGDGVNDAPALKSAHIGIAMGNRGTDVARESAALVLLDDNFTSIVSAVRLGRRIYDNIQKAVTYILAIHIPIVGLTLVPLVLGTPAILWPVHLAFLQLIIDPVCSIVFEAEPESSSVMQRTPRSLNAKLFSRKIIGTSLIEGFVSLCAVLVVYVWLGKSGDQPNHARAVAFVTLIFINIALIFSNRAGNENLLSSITRKNPALIWVGTALLGLTGIVLYIPSIAVLFHFETPHLLDLVYAAIIAVLILFILELIKSLIGRSTSKRKVF